MRSDFSVARAGAPSSSTISGSATSSCILGRIRSSQLGSHQFASPSSTIAAGTSTTRTIVASMRTANASPIPNIYAMGSGCVTKLRITVGTLVLSVRLPAPDSASPQRSARHGQETTRSDG
jgi:hypothetical protein